MLSDVSFSGVGQGDHTDSSRRFLRQGHGRLPQATRAQHHQGKSRELWKSVPAGTYNPSFVQAKKHAIAMTLNSRQRFVRRVPGLIMYRLGQTAKTSRLAQPS